MKDDRLRAPMILRAAIVSIGLLFPQVASIPLAHANADEVAEPELRFVDERDRVRAISLSALRSACPERAVDVSDPYHDKPMRYVAMSLRCVLDRGFAASGGAEAQGEHGLLLRALDGYTRPVSGRDLLEPGAFLAFGEPDLMASASAESRFSKLDRRGVDPGPFYMVWVGAAQNDPHVHPWPYQLATIEVATFSEAFPETKPEGLAASDAGWAGYALFQDACASCHAINGQGGKVGPDLNVPRSIVEYRPIDQIRSYIRNPQATRYTSMPPHPGLSEADLDALIAYFSAMSERKADPGRSDDS